MCIVVDMLWIALIVACTSGADPMGEAFTLDIDVQTAPNQTDLFSSIARMDLIVEYPTGDVVYPLSTATAGTSAEVIGVEPLDEVSVALAAYGSDDALVAFGRSASLEISEGEISTSILLLRIDDFAWLSLESPNVFGAAVSSADGRFWLSGGSESNGGVTVSERDTVEHLWRLSVTDTQNIEEMDRTDTPLPDLSTEDLNAGSNQDVVGRLGHTMTRLNDGRILVVGGAGALQDGELTSQEAYLMDPDAETFERIGSRPALPSSRAGHNAVVLASGNVVITGGFGRTGATDTFTFNDALIVYDVNASSFSELPVSEQSSGSNGAAIARLGSEGALVCGGFSTNFGGPPFRSEVGCDIVGLEGGIESAAPLPLGLGKLYAVLTPLSNGDVLLTGGFPMDPSAEIPVNDELVYTATSQAFRFSDGSWDEVRPMNNARAHHVATPLPDGRVLVAGGFTQMTSLVNFLDLTALPCAEIFDPVENAWEEVGSSCDADSSQGALPIAVGKPAIAADDDYGVLVMGGIDSDGRPVSNAALFVGAPDLD